MAAAVTLADRELIADLARDGFVVTAQKLRRWRAAGVIPSPIRTARGRGRGITSDRYPPETREAVRMVCTLLAERVSLDAMPVMMLLRGGWVRLDRVRTALIAEVGTQDWSPDQSEDLAERHAEQIIDSPRRRPQARRWLTRAGREHGRRSPAYEDAIFALMHLAYGNVAAKYVSDAAMARTFGFDPLIRRQVAKEIGAMPLKALADVARTATLPELRAAVTVVEHTIQLIVRLQADAPLAQSLAGITDLDPTDQYALVSLIVPVIHNLRTIPGYADAISTVNRSLQSGAEPVALLNAARVANQNSSRDDV